MLDVQELFRECRQLRKEGESGKALVRLGDSLRQRTLGADDVLRAGRLLRSIAAEERPADVMKVTVLGQCTTTWLVEALTAVGKAHRFDLSVQEADYDNVLQGMHGLAADTDAIILLPWNQRLYAAADRGAGERVLDEVAFWQSVWQVAADCPNLRIVQVGYDWVDAGADGYALGSMPGGVIDLVRRTNLLLREKLPAGAYLVDLEHASGQVGRDQMYDPRRYHWTKQPFSEFGTVKLAEHVFAGLRALTTGPKKVLALDLDNTLWGGVVGELGPLGIELGDTPAGEAFRDFQRLVKSLSERGVVLVVCSKNNPEDAREPFLKNPDMVLRLEDFAAFRAGWMPKNESLSEIAAELRLGLDSVVFFDDEPAERLLVQQTLPEVEVVNVPEDPADYRAALLDGLWFETATLSEEDKLRTAQYGAERRRQSSSKGAASVEDYLESLGLCGEIGPVDESTISRASQLVAKTNQFNLTTRRHSLEAIDKLRNSAGAISLTLRLSDRFGDYGLVGVLLAVRDDDGDAKQLRIDTWLMSCRVIGRTVEQFMFNALLQRANAASCSAIIGEYIPTPKNAVVSNLYEQLGFEHSHNESEGAAIYRIDVASATPATTFVSSIPQSR